MSNYFLLILFGTIAALLVLFNIGLKIYQHQKLKKRLPERTLGELRIGDSFVFSRTAKEIWRVMKKENTLVYVNQKMRSDMHTTHEEDVAHYEDTSVFFIRHTIPLPGEKIFMEDLAPGDVLVLLDHNADQWEIIEKGYDFDTIKNIGTGQEGKVGRMCEVLFVRHKK